MGEPSVILRERVGKDNLANPGGREIVPSGASQMRRPRYRVPDKACLEARFLARKFGSKRL
jgi:hypothetical protein